MRSGLLAAALAAFVGGCSNGGDVAVDHLAVIAIGPSPGATGIGIDADVLVTFSEVLRAESVNQGSICLKPAGDDDSTCSGADVVPAQTTYDAVDLAITVSPSLVLTTGTEYAIVITRDIRAESGSLPSSVRTLFTTESP